VIVENVVFRNRGLGPVLGSMPYVTLKRGRESAEVDGLVVMIKGCARD